MEIEYIPLLHVQLGLYRIPLGAARFEEYLRLTIERGTEHVRIPPLGLMNPMGELHLNERLERWIEIGADKTAADALEGVTPNQPHKASLIMVDDAKGGWTNRITLEFSRFMGAGKYCGHPWLGGVLWASDEPSVELARIAMLKAVYRRLHVLENGKPQTLRDVLKQEGNVLNRSNATVPPLSEEESDSIWAVIKPNLQAEDWPTLVACLFGDRAALSLGYSPMGLPDHAGLHFACHEMRLPVK